jgi:hypothetical protein
MRPGPAALPRRSRLNQSAGLALILTGQWIMTWLCQFGNRLPFSFRLNSEAKRYFARAVEKLKHMIAD